MVDKKYENDAKKAMSYLKQAKYALKTGIFKWNKDYDEAAVKYELAAKAFKEISDDDSASNAYLEAAKCHEH